MRLRRFFIHGLLYVPFLWHRLTANGPFRPGVAAFLEEPVRSDDPPLKAALFRHHVKQYHEASCSVASVVTAVNAIRDVQGDRSRPITQMEILQKVRTGYWQERMSPEGHNGRRGLPLSLLGEIVKSSLDIYGVAYKTVATVPGAPDAALAEMKRRELRHRLINFETKGDSLIIAHFGQGVFVRTLNIPHISPVGGFEARSGRVTILDVDPDQDKPYRVPFDTFCKGIFNRYNPALRLVGYRTGGYVYIKLA